MSENNQFEFLWKQIQGVMQEMISPITYEMYISKLVPGAVVDRIYNKIWEKHK